MSDSRELAGYWLVWQGGMEWPEQFYNQASARARVAMLAKQNIGYAAHICKLEPVGAMMIPMNVTVEGIMGKDAI